MPQALFLFGRKLPFSADDLFLPGLVGTITRVSMAIGIIVCLAYANTRTSSASGVVILILNPCVTRTAEPIENGFLAAALVFMVVHAIMYMYMIKVSLTGTILDWKARHSQGVRLVNALTVSYIIELALGAYGIAVLVMNGCGKMSNVWIVLLSTLVMIWVDILSAIGFAYFLYHRFSPGIRREVTWYQKRLRGIGWGFNLLTCGLFGDLQTPEGHGDEAWLMFSEVVHTFLHEMMQEIVVSDVFAGVLLLRAEQKRIQDQTIKELTSRALSINATNSPLGVTDVQAFSEASALEEGTSKRSPLQSFLWGSEHKIIKLKAQVLNSATPVSPRGSWISNLIASEGRVADPTRRLEAFQQLEEFARYSPYQEAIYGWKLFLYSTPLQFIVSFKWLNLSWLFPQSTGHSKSPQGVKRPNLQSMIEGRVFAHVTGLKDHHIIYASFTAYLGEMVPYAICVDHDRQAVVITMRGTMSFGDLVTDLMAVPTELDLAGRQWGFDGKGHYAHSGMFQIANRIRLDIEKQGILEKIFHKDKDSMPNSPVKVEGMFSAERFVTKKQLDETDISHYKLRVVGHSLGAGVASVLTLLLLEKYPQVHGLAYSPPGAIFSREMAERSTQWISSIVCGVDAIPRLSWHNAKKLRGQLFEMLRRSKTSKARVWSTLFRNIPASELLHDSDRVPNEEVRSDISRIIQKLAQESDTDLDRVRMYAPGKVLHLAKTATVHNCCGIKERKFTPMWVEDRADLNEFQISQWLLFDHFPDYNGRVIRKTLKEALAAEGRQSFGGVALLDAINPKLEA